MPERPAFSVVILTLNEERNLPGCLASVAGCDDIVVLDSGSTDRTAEIARAAGARVIVNPFVNFGDQRNFAHAHGHFRHDWVFHLDADEQMTPELFAECARVAAANPPLDGFYAAPRMMFHGDWMRRCTDWPAWQARFVRPARFRFVQSGHGQREAPGLRLGRLEAGYTHDISVESAAEWETKHRRYARQEAEKILRESAGAARLLQRVWSGPALERRRALKHLSYLLPARPLLRFIYQYFLRGGFLDGRQAFRYCRLLARYEGYATAELKRQRLARRSLGPNTGAAGRD
jgi:glycosyltransferase involved in cell wall biosynthesis